LIEKNQKNYTAQFLNNSIEITTPINYENNLVITLLKKTYKQKAKEHIPSIVEKYSSMMNLTPSATVYRYAKRKWASCTSKNTLSFNPEIMKLSKKSIEYIVIHELAHIEHKNHKKEFWALVSKYMPTYKKQMQIITNMSKDLFFI
jgi:predicted metal-dependent hydrolase